METAPDMGGGALYERVCMSVCLSVCLSARLCPKLRVHARSSASSFSVGEIILFSLIFWQLVEKNWFLATKLFLPGWFFHGKNGFFPTCQPWLPWERCPVTASLLPLANTVEYIVCISAAEKREHAKLRPQKWLEGRCGLRILHDSYRPCGASRHCRRHLDRIICFCRAHY